tara:strand:- start:395 stop:1858 length:1464 start_codon:yes stop_codon:yes gene_type:complete
MSFKSEVYYTYDDVLIKPKYSEITSRKNVSLESQLTPNIKLNIPIISSNMDTITEDKMAIEMAKLGGLGIIHRYCTIDAQVEMVKKVKRYTNYIISHPYTISNNSTMGNVLDKIKNNNKSLLVIDTDNFLKGIITQRDLIYFNSVGNRRDPVVDFMTNITKMITIEKSELKNLSIPELIKILTSNKIQKLPIIENGELHGLITLKDMIDRSVNSIFKPNLDKNSQLIVGCAIGVNKDYLERARKVIDAGCDIICIDVAHGHHKLCGDAVREIKSLHPHTSIIAGNVCTAEGVEYLASCGADCVKVGIGPGGICITRKQTGCGAPQLTSVLKCAKKAKELGITVIADGGHNGCIGNIFKALCCGSSASMLGGMLSGTLETPGQIYTKLDRKVKQIRGMAGIMSNYNKAEKLGQSTNNLETMTPEGVEGYVTYKGPVKDIINQICGGLRSGLSYVGCGSLENLNPDEIEFILITQSGYQESGSHGISEI